MKKTCIFFVFIFCVIASQAQLRRPADSVNIREYDERYFFPDAVRAGCTEMTLDAIGTEDVITFNSPIYCMSYPPAIDDSNILYDYAQPYSLSDTAIRIAGISGLIQVFWDHGRDGVCIDSTGIVSCFLEIRDMSLENILASIEVPVNTTSIWRSTLYTSSVRYYEAFFDDVLTMGRDFYVVFHTPDRVDRSVWDMDNPENRYWHYEAGVFYYNVDNECAKMHKDALFRKNDFQWQKFTFDWYSPDSHYMFYLFPILAEEGSWDGGYVDISDYVKISPNPATDIVNVNCGYKMNSLEMYNELGIKVKSAKPESHNYGLNISELPKGIYFVEIFTSKGKTTKKLLKQ